MKRVFRYLLTLAREIADENAYERHLRVTGHIHSGVEWRAFIDRRHKGKFQSAKCC